MQFTPTNVEPTVELSPNSKGTDTKDSKVTVTFAGLILIKPAAGNTLEAGIHKFSSDHFFQVMLLVNQSDRPPRVIRLLQGPLFSDFEMVVDPAGDGVQKFVADGDAFVRSNEANNEKDFRWAFNFAALPGHEEVDINDGACPLAKLNAGVLYSANLTRRNLGPSLIQGFDKILTQGFDDTDLNRFSIDLAASVELPEGRKMTLKWTELGAPQYLVLPRDIDPVDTTYTVALVNDPAVLIDPATDDSSVHDEFDEYYKVLQIENAIVPDNLRCHIEVPPGQRSDEIPCLAGTLERPGGH